MMSGIPIRGTAKGNAGIAFNVAKRRGAQRLDFLLEYLSELYRFAFDYGIDADVLVAQADLETGAFTSDYYLLDGNVAGFGVPSNGPAQGWTYTAKAAARAQVIHHCAYLGIAVSLSDQRLDPRWQDVIRAGYFGTVATTADYGNGRWAEDPDYAHKLVERYTAYWGNPPLQETPPMGFDIGNRPVRIAIGTGHANTSGGNAFELSINRLTVNEVLKLARRSDGFDVRCYTPNDGLGYFNGPLDAAAAQVRSWVAAGWKPDICIEVHQEGLGNSSVRGGFFIYPDSAGLRGRKATGADYVDKDVKAAAGEMARILVAEYGGVMRYRSAPRGMSERETGVGGKGSRLGLFGAWSDQYFVDNACCLIVEGATYTNPTDLTLMKRPDFPQNLAVGILKALVYLAETRGEWTYRYTIGGVIVPTDPKPTTVPPIPVDVLKPYVAAGQIIKAPPIEGITAANGDVYEYLGYQVRALKPIWRKQSAAANAPNLGDNPIAAGTVFDPGFRVRRKVGGIRLVSPWWSWIDPADVEIVIEEIAA
jgi:N-acetylmuramoyl-L-alanine amidase